MNAKLANIKTFSEWRAVARRLYSDPSLQEFEEAEFLSRGVELAIERINELEQPHPKANQWCQADGCFCEPFHTGPHLGLNR